MAINAPITPITAIIPLTGDFVGDRLKGACVAGVQVEFKAARLSRVPEKPGRHGRV